MSGSIAPHGTCHSPADACSGSSLIYDGTFLTPFKYVAVEENTECYELPKAVVGDQTTIKVSIDCESPICKYNYELRFGCEKTYPTGLQILRSSAVAQPEAPGSLRSPIPDTLVTLRMAVTTPEPDPALAEQYPVWGMWGIFLALLYVRACC